MLLSFAITCVLLGVPALVALIAYRRAKGKSKEQGRLLDDTADVIIPTFFAAVAFEALFCVIWAVAYVTIGG